MSSTTSKQRGASQRRTSTSNTRPKSAARSAPAARTSSKSSAAPPRRARRRPGWLVPLAALAALAVIGWALYPAVQLQYQTSRRVGSLEQQYQALRSRNNVLRAKVSAMQTAAGVEEVARASLGLAKKGEQVFVVVPSPGATGSSKVATAAPPARSALQSFLDAIFGVKTSADATRAP